MKNKLFIVILLFLSACYSQKGDSDAYGTFEATEITISSEVPGKILSISAEEGSLVKMGQLTIVIDTTDWLLKKSQLEAQKLSIASRYPNVASQIAVFQQQIQNLLIEKQRIENLIKDGAATMKQLDDINGNIDLVKKQILSVETQNTSVAGDLTNISKQIEQIEANFKRCFVKSPITGIILDKYVEVGELASPGKPLYKIADLSVLYLRVYVSGAQLPLIKLGDKTEVYIDKNKYENTKLEGEICWISSLAEFTPKIIQTKEERVNLVYAVKIRVVNDGTLKIGMPGEVKFITN